jgi:hypothetical protein
MCTALYCTGAVHLGPPSQRGILRNRNPHSPSVILIEAFLMPGATHYTLRASTVYGYINKKSGTEDHNKPLLL